MHFINEVYTVCRNKVHFSARPRMTSLYYDHLHCCGYQGLYYTHLKGFQPLPYMLLKMFENLIHHIQASLNILGTSPNFLLAYLVLTLGVVIALTKIIEKTTISVKLSASAISRIVVPSNRRKNPSHFLIISLWQPYKVLAAGCLGMNDQ